MSDDELYDLVIEWDARRERGEEVSPEYLCADHPVLLDELKECIAGVIATDWISEVGESDDDEFPSLPNFDTVANQADETQLPSSELSVEQFARAIVESGLLTFDDVAAAQNVSSADDTESLALELVGSNKLTGYQASVILEGRSSPLLLDRYVILDTLDSGGMGLVFKALHRSLERIVALKTLPPAAVDSPDKVKRFRREARAAAKLDHANIVTTHDAHESNGVHFLVMEYVKGQDLYKAVAENGPQPVGKAVNYLLQTARGLEHAHKQGIIHRDIKPANLLLDENGVVKVLDMGLARIESSDNDDTSVSQDLTQDGTVMGTAAYMSPEQALDPRMADHRSDIYSLGCTLHFLLTGHSPYRESTSMKIALAHRENPIPSISDGRDDVAEELIAVYQRMLAKNPEDRFQSMNEVIEALLACAVAEDSATQQIGIETPTNLSTQNETGVDVPATGGSLMRRGIWAAGAVAVVIVAVLYFAGVIFKVKTPDGTLVIEVDDPKNVVVEIDGQKANVKLTPDGKAIEISIEPGTRNLVVKTGDGTVLKTNGDKIEVAAGKTQRIRAWLEKAKPSGKRKIADSPRWKPTPAQQKFIDAVAKLNPEQQIDAVRERLKLVNPGFDGKLTHKIVNGRVVELKFFTDQVTDISPVRALSRLERLGCLGSRFGTGRLTDLSPLEGMKLTYLHCTSSPMLQDLSPLKGIPLKSLYVYNTQVTDLSPLRGMPLGALNFGTTPVSDLSPLKGMPLKNLTFSYTRVADLSPLRGMSLRVLDCANTLVADLSPLERMPLETLRCQAARIVDLSPLHGMPLQFDVRLYHRADETLLKTLPLKTLNRIPTADFWKQVDAQRKAAEEFADSTAKLPAEKQIEAVRARLSELEPTWKGMLTAKVTGLAVTEVTLTVQPRDMTPLMALKGMKKLTITSGYDWLDISPINSLPLEELTCPGPSARKNALVLKGMKTLKTINARPAVEFWKPENTAWKPTAAQQKFIDTVAKLKPEQQIEAVRERLKLVNPGFDGTLQHKIANGRVVELLFFTDQVTDISPVRALSGLERLRCRGSTRGKGRLMDLSPLKGMPLTLLACVNNPVADLSPLKGIPLKSLYCYSTKVTDLSPLQGMPLGALNLGSTQVADLSPLKGMPLTHLSINDTKVADLSPLRGMSLILLDCPNTLVADLAPLARMPLDSLSCIGTRVADLSPLHGMPLSKLTYNLRLYQRADETPLKSLPLKILNDMPPADFWKQVTARRKAAEEFVDSTAKLPADKQIKAVRARFAELVPKWNGTFAPRITGLTVTEISLSSQPQDLTPLMAFKGLKKLTINGRPDWPDISPVNSLPLEELTCPELTAKRNAIVLKGIKTLKTINARPAAEFWKTNK